MLEAFIMLRVSVAAAFSITLLAAPAAWACSQALVFGDSRPRDVNTPVPAATLVVLETFGFSGFDFEASLTVNGGSESLRMEVVPAGPDHLIIPLPNLRARRGYTLTVDAPMAGAEHRIDILSFGEPDVEAPIGPRSMSLSAQRVVNDLCWGTGWWVDASFVPGSDDRGISGYFLLEPDEDGDLAPVGATLHPIDFEPEGLNVRIFVREGGQHCYSLATLDYGGNVTDENESPFGCITLGESDMDAGAPPPPIDAGIGDALGRDALSGDATAPPRDGGPAGGPADAGGLSGLDPADPSCGCTTGGSIPGSTAPGAIAFALALLLLRRGGARDG